MANESDGSITIDTELDNTGFEKGSDKLLGAVKDLTGAVDTLGDNMMRSFSQVIPLLSNISGSVAAVNDKMAETATQAMDANARVVESEQQVSQVAQQAAQAVNQQGQSMNTLVAGATSAQSSISSLEREVNALSTGMQSVSKSAETGFANGNAVLTFESKLDAVESKLTTMKSKVEQFASTKIPTEDYQWLTAAIQKAEGEYDKLLDRQMKMNNAGVAPRSKSWATLASDMELVQRKLSEYKSDLASLEQSGQAFTLGSSTEEYARMKASVDETAAALDRNRGLIDSEALAQARLNVAAAQERLIRAESAAEQAAAQENLRAAQQALSGVAASMSNKGVSAPSEDAISGWQRFGQILRSAGSAAVSVVSTLAKAPFATLGKGIKSAVNSLKQFVSQSKKATLTSNGLVRALTSIKTLLKTRIKRMFISAIINGVKESMQSLALFSSEFDKSMSSIKNSSKGLGANLAVSLGGLINALAPIISKIINAISTAITYLNAFFALLSGKSTVVVAKKQTESYAASLKKAGGAAEDLKRQVYGFDQLNKRNSDKDKDSGGGDGKDLFENADIDSLLPKSVRDFFDKIKAAFEAGDWYGIGMIIAEGLNRALKVVDDWINEKLRPLGVLWAERIALILNGLVDGFDWGSLGKTIADGINAAFDILNTFLATFKFENLGVGVGEAINDMFTFIEWDLIGQTLANKWNALIDFFYGLVTTPGMWTNIGASMAECFNNAVSTIKWEKLCETLVTGFNGVVSSLGTFIGNIKWRELGAKFCSGIYGAIQNIDWPAVGQLLSNAVIGLYDFAIGGMESIDFYDAASSITGGLVDMVANIDWGRLAGTLAVYFVEAFAGSIQALLGALDGLSSKLAILFEEMGLDGIAGFFGGLSDALRGTGTWLKKNFVDPVVNAIKNLFGIHSPSTVFAEIGKNLIAGLYEGVKKTWGSITQFFINATTAMKNTLSSAWSSIKTTASTKWGEIKTTVTTLWDGLKTTLSNTDWTSVGSNICSGIRDGINAGWTWLKTTVSNLATNLLDAAKGELDINSPSRVFRDEVGKNIGLGMAEGITDTEADVLQTVSNLAQDTADAFDTDTLALNIEGDATVTGLDAVANKLAGIAATFKSITDMLTSLGGLNMPQIAAGTVAPAKTRIDTSDSSNVTLAGFSDFTSGFDEYMAEQSGLLRQLIEIVKKLNLNIDVDSLSKMITSAQKAQAHSFGGVY